MSKALVTGGCGFIGSNLVDRLIELFDEIVVIDNLSSDSSIVIDDNAVISKNDTHSCRLRPVGLSYISRSTDDLGIILNLNSEGEIIIFLSIRQSLQASPYLGRLW